MPQEKLQWTIEMLNGVERETDEWKKFVKWQKQRILERLDRYNNITTVKSQLEEKGEPTAYQNYKIGVVSGYLRTALTQIEKGNYGICVSCNNEIAAQRLLLVPGALNCMKCENSKPKNKQPWDNI